MVFFERFRIVACLLSSAARLRGGVSFGQGPSARAAFFILVEVVVMAPRLTDKQKKKIVADYLETGSYNATGKKNGVSKDTVRRVIKSCDEFAQKAQQKKEENTADILAYMESKRERICELIDIGLEVLPEKMMLAKSPTEITTALGTLIDKWAAIAPKDGGPDIEDDPITKSLNEEFGEGAL